MAVLGSRYGWKVLWVKENHGIGLNLKASVCRCEHPGDTMGKLWVGLGTLGVHWGEERWLPL